MAAELQPLEAPITAGLTIPTTTTTALPVNTATTTVTAIETTTTALPSTERPQLGQKRLRRPSVRLGEIGDQPAATVSFESHMRRAKQHPAWRLPKDPKSVKARSITNLVNGSNDSRETTPHDDRNQNGDIGFEFGNRRVKAKRATGIKRIRSTWASNSKLDGGGDEGGEWFSADPDQDSPARDEESPVNSADEDLWEGQRTVAGNWARVSQSRENDAVEGDNKNMPESNWSGVRSWLIELGLSRYTPVFEIHEVDDDVLPMLTLEDLKDMGINAVGSRRKMYSAIQKLRKGFS